MTIEAVMAECHNFFEDGYADAEFTVTANGTLTPAVGVLDNQYVCIRGSTFHDGVWQMVSGKLTRSEDDDFPAESFTGRLWYLHPPGAFLDIVESITAFDQKTPVTGLQSESFGGYTYTRASGSQGALRWQEAYSSMLMPYRRMFSEVG